jgi:Domain of unknown function (DUF4157)
VPPIVQEVLRSPSQPLDPATRAFMEPRFGHDFTRVRIHTDAKAAESACAVNALAYTVGQDVVFGRGQYVPHTASGRRLIVHEFTHTLQQRDSSPLSPDQSPEIGQVDTRWEAEAKRNANSPAIETVSAGTLFGTAMQLQCQNDREALRARLQQVRARLAQLRNQQVQLSDEFSGSLMQGRQRESLERGRRQLREQVRSDTAARSLWGGTFAGERIRSAVTASQSANTATVSANLELTYLALSDADARQRAASDIPRIESAIRNVWQVDITSGDYAGISFRLRPTVTYLPRNSARANNAFLIQVRGPDGDPSSGDSVSGTISLAPVHLEGSRVIVVAHELAHLFGFTDAYLKMTTRGSRGQTIERWSVARPDPTNRPDLLGMIDPVVLGRLQRQGAVTSQDVARQTGTVHVWEEEASTILRTLGVAPLPPQRPTPENEDFDPAVELDRVQRESEARLAPIRERRQRAENSLQWLQIVEEIMRLEREEASLRARLASSP